MTHRAFTVPALSAARRMAATPGALVVSVGFYVLVVGVLAALWHAAADAAGGAVAGYTAVALTWYVATSEAAVVSINLKLIEETGDAVGSGAVAVELLRPAPPVVVRLGTEAGRSLARAAVLLPAGVLLAWLVAGPPPSPAAAGLAVPSLVLAVLCNVAAQHAAAAASFWVRDARSSWFLYQKAVFILGGMLLPLQVLPGGLRAVAGALPFQAMAYAPARLASGHVEPGLLLAQAAWLTVLTVLAVALFAAGERRLQVVGG